ncbi:MAG: type II secretion system minor pseudopilin GspI [Pseudomonadota bacterium]
MSGKERGFSLIEVVVALGVISVAMLALVRIAGENAKAVAAMEEKALAGIVAENRLIELLFEREQPPAGKSEGEIELAGRNWTLTERVSATADPDIFRIDLSVQREGEDRQAADLTGFWGRD